MGPFARCLRAACIVLALSVGVLLSSVYWAYKVFDEGEIFLDNAPGIVSILREKDT